MGNGIDKNPPKLHKINIKFVTVKTENMNQKFDKSSISIPIGLFFLSGTIILSQFENIPDTLRGILFGISIGLIALAFIKSRIKPTSN